MWYKNKQINTWLSEAWLKTANLTFVVAFKVGAVQRATGPDVELSTAVRYDNAFLALIGIDASVAFIGLQIAAESIV